MARVSNMVVARETMVVVVGARPIEYRKAMVRDRKTDQIVEVELNEAPPLDPGDEGVPYAFKAGEKVPRNHEAVKASPGSFISLDEAENLDLIDT